MIWAKLEKYLNEDKKIHIFKSLIWDMTCSWLTYDSKQPHMWFKLSPFMIWISWISDSCHMSHGKFISHNMLMIRVKEFSDSSYVTWTKILGIMKVHDLSQDFV